MNPRDAVANAFVTVPLIRHRLAQQLAAASRPGAPPPVVTQAQLDYVAARMKSDAMFWAIAFAAIDGLIILKLLSRSVREEFDAAD